MLFMHSPGGPILSHYRINSPADEFKTLFICKWTLLCSRFFLLKGIKHMHNSDAFNLYLTCDRMKGVNKEGSVHLQPI